MVPQIRWLHAIKGLIRSLNCSPKPTGNQGSSWSSVVTWINWSVPITAYTATVWTSSIFWVDFMGHLKYIAVIQMMTKTCMTLCNVSWSKKMCQDESIQKLCLPCLLHIPWTGTMSIGGPQNYIWDWYTAMQYLENLWIWEALKPKVTWFLFYLFTKFIWPSISYNDSRWLTTIH